MNIIAASFSSAGRKNIFRWLAVCLMLAAGVPAAAMPNFVTRAWSRENGLPQNTVTAVAQTRDGYLWTGTYNGLARFDGVRFVTFDGASTPGLRDSRITSLFEGNDGTLWIGHETGELTAYADGKFAPVPVKARWKQKSILDISADETGEVWLLNSAGWLARVNDGQVLVPESGTELGLIEMTRSASGTIWVGRNGRISVLQQDRITPLKFTEDIANQAVEGLGASRDGGIWLLVGGRLRKWKEDGWAEDRGPSPQGGAPLLKLIECRNGMLVGTTSDVGLALVSPDKTSLRFNRQKGFPSDWIKTAGEDREGNIWVGTGGSGLILLRESSLQAITPPDKWKGRSIRYIYPDTNNVTWIGTEGAGIYRYADRTWTNYWNGNKGLGNPYIWAMTRDLDGNLFATTWGAGLHVWRGDHFEIASQMENVLTPMPAMVASRDGGLWIGTTEGLLRYDAAGKQNWFRKNDEAIKTDIRCVLEAGTEDVWFGTAGEGLFHLHHGALTQYRKTDGLAGDFVQCLLLDDDGTIWVGTSEGLCQFKENHFGVIRVKQGLPDNFICDIQDDGRGFFWINSLNGIFRIAKKESQKSATDQSAVHCLLFGIGDGMPTLEGSGRGGRAADGKLWFSTSRGVVVIDPQDVKTSRLPPPVRVESMFVDNQIILRGEKTKAGISPGRHRFEFQYTALSFMAPEKVRFKHKLDGVDADWIDAGSRRAAEYNLLPPGAYTFHVAACNSDGIWNETGDSVAFILQPYLWQTVWFRVLSLAGIILSAGGIAWYGTRRRMRLKLERMERQRGVERERTRIARDIHDDLGASLTRINLLSQTARRGMDNLPQTTKSLDQICTTARQLTRAMDEIVWAVDPQHDTLDSLASYLGKLIHEMLGETGIRCRLDFPVYLPAWPLTAEARHNLFLACKEALHNVIKHSEATEVLITFALEDSTLVLKIKDNGHGFDDAERRRTEKETPGNGLANMRQRLNEIGGNFSLQSERAAGTEVVFCLPLSDCPDNS